MLFRFESRYAFRLVFSSLFAGTASLAFAQAAPNTVASGITAYSLEELITIARRDSHVLHSARAQALAARAGVVSSRAIPNPEIEITRGPVNAVQAGAPSGTGQGVLVSQRIENPALRSARQRAATTGAQGAEIQIAAVENAVVGQIKVSFFNLLRREEELAATQEDLLLTEQIRERIRVRTRSGEGARFDLLRADSEVTIATKEKERAQSRVAQARPQLRQAVGAPLPDPFSVRGDFYRAIPAAEYASLREALFSGNPEIKRSLTDITRAEQQLEVERQQVLPAVSLRLMQESMPDTRSVRAGIAISVPLFDRRAGPIDEARAQLIRTRSDADARRFDLTQGFDTAWQQFQGALKTVQALEGGIIQQARTIVDIAEAAYRFGERGILEYLDARRQFRIVRNELIEARFELFAARAELERLAARDIKGE